MDGQSMPEDDRSSTRSNIASKLPDDALDASRAVLSDYGNMSSATLMFVLARLLDGPPVRNGVALAFGPGLAAEGFGFRSAA